MDDSVGLNEKPEDTRHIQLLIKYNIKMRPEEAGV